MIVGFSGTRAGPTPAQNAAMTRLLLKLAINHGLSRLVHGGSKGCDTLAHNVVTASGLNRSIAVEIHPAGSDHSSVVSAAYAGFPMGNCTIYPELTPLERNRVLVRRIHGLIAVPKTDRETDWAAESMTWAAVRFAREIGCPVYVVQQNGTIVRDRDPVFG